MEITAVPQLSSIGRRFVAVILDIIILLVPCFIVNFAVPFAGPFLLCLFYQPVLEASPVQATLGKRAMGILVTTVKGERLTFGMACLRYVVAAGSSCAFCLGHLVAFFSVRKQALHDLVADTIVVRGTVEGISPVTAWKETLVAFFSNFSSSTEKKYSPSQTTPDVLSRLEKLQELRTKGAISEEEFARMKADILRSV